MTLAPLSRDAVAARIRRLAATLIDLKARVRVAVATEAGTAVAHAIRDLLTAALGGRALPPPEPVRPGAARRGDADDRDPWTDDADDDYDDDRYPRSPRAVESEPASNQRTNAPAARWPAAFDVAVAAVRGWAAGRLPGWAAATVGVLVGAAVVAGGPVLHAGLALASAAAALLPPSAPLLFPH